MSDISFDHVLSSQYTVFDGLAGMHVEDLYQDREGFLWIATADGGVSRFDSARFDTFGLKDGLPNLTVMAIAEDADGRLLFGTFGGGLAAYDGRGFQVYTTEHGLPSNEIVGLQAQPDGSILVLAVEGVAWFAEGRCVKCITDIGDQPLGRGVRYGHRREWYYLAGDGEPRRHQPRWTAHEYRESGSPMALEVRPRFLRPSVDRLQLHGYRSLGRSLRSTEPTS